jgi:hypothetical protein
MHAASSSTETPGADTASPPEVAISVSEEDAAAPAIENGSDAASPVVETPVAEAQAMETPSEAEASKPAEQASSAGTKPKKRNRQGATE